MKRIIYIFITLMIAFSLVCPVVAYASETEEGGTMPPSEETVTTTEGEETLPEETPEQVPEAPEEEAEVNFFTRLYEAYLNNKSELFTLLGSGVLFVLSMILKKDLGAVAKKKDVYQESLAG